MSRLMRRQESSGPATFDILQVVENTSSMTTADQKINDWLDASSIVNSVTLLSHTAAEEDTTDGHQVAVLSVDCSNTQNKYRGDGTNPIPWIDMDWNGQQESNRERTNDGSVDFNYQSTIYYNSSTEITWTGESTGTAVSFIDGANSTDHKATIPTDGHVMCGDDSGMSHSAIASFEAGDTMDGAIDTDVRGVACSGTFRALTGSVNLTTAGTQLLDDVLDWVGGNT